MIRFSLIFILLNIAYSSTYAVPTPRWYTAEQQTKGAQLFKENCAVCHGDRAQSTPNWKQPNAQGQYPPPPLDGTAHAWHHDLKTLHRSIKNGGVNIGGLMPPFKDKLNKEDRDSVIAFFQSLWPDELYKKWSENFKVAPAKTVAIPTNEPNPITILLTKRLNNTTINNLQPIAEKQLYEVSTQGQTIYLTPDGRFALIGKLIDLKTGQNLTPGKK